MPTLLDSVRTEYQSLPALELLHRPARVLLGVTPDAAAALTKLEIHTVFDLATSSVFAAATKLLQAGGDLKSLLYRHGNAPADLIDEAAAGGRPVEELQYLPIGVIHAIPDAETASIESALDAANVRDLALYPPYRAAVHLLESLYFPENADGFDPERPDDLVPASGEYPTERVQYTTLIMGEIEQDEDTAILDIKDKAFSPLDLAALAADDAGFTKVAFGALLTFNQSWYAEGVALGQLLHSTALAPGESTRVAVIDWSRKSRAGETESISETDDLTNDMSQNRSISEVTEAVANEAQEGFSETSAKSTTKSKGTSAAGEISAPLGGLFGGPSGSMGSTSSESTTSSSGDSYSTSSGHREIASSMLQNVNDRTHQHAHSSRTRRASVVKEVAQSEHENVSTRVLANYNHMHALTIQYYEVVQIYRVEAALHRADRVVFIPVKLVDFTTDAMIKRFRGVLARAALTYEIRRALQNLDVLEITPDTETRFPALGGIHIKDAIKEIKFLPKVETQPVPRSRTLAGDVADTVKAEVVKSAQPLLFTKAQPVAQQLNDVLWDGAQIARISGILSRAILRPESTAMNLPTDVTVEGVLVAAEGASVRAVFHTVDGRQVNAPTTQAPLPLSEVTRIGLIGSNADREISASVTLTLSRNGVRFPLELPAAHIAKAAGGETRLVAIKAGGVDANIREHLRTNRLYYSQAIFRSLDGAQIAQLLAGLGVKVGSEIVPVAQAVEPRPIRFVGNYLAFKMNIDRDADEDWRTFLDAHGIRVGSKKMDIVPLASGGTFAEAVLGRSNSAEKLDITRFWNWQDSPIPLQPTEIAAIQTGSRATPEDTQPGQLSNPIINMMSPTNLPDPVGTAAALAAIQNGNMFRDMSGLQATIGLAQAALEASSSGAAAAGQQAGENMNNLLKANTERQRIAAGMISSLAGTAAGMFTGGLAGGGGGGIPAGAPSTDGAKINYFDKTRGAAPAASGGGGGGGGAVDPVTGGGSSGGGGELVGPPASGYQNAMWDGGSGGYSQNPAALAATWRDSQSPSDLYNDILGRYPSNDDLLGMDTAGGTGTKVAAKELNIGGEFAWDPAITGAEEIAELAGKRWTPSTDDFAAVPGGTVSTADTFGGMLGAILTMPDAGISRVNVFTHGDKKLIAFGGRIVKNTATPATVWLNTNSPSNSLIAMDPAGMATLLGGASFVSPTPIKGKTNFTVADIRKKFAENAFIVLYACKSAQDPAFLKQIAQFFQVKVIGFSDLIGYFPPAQTTPSKFQRAGTKVGIGLNGSPVTDWRNLITDPKAVTAVP